MALSILNPNPQSLPGPTLLHDLIAQSAQEDSLAIDFERYDGVREQLTYADLHNRSNALSSWLMAQRKATATQATARFIVPLYIPQSADLYTAQLAVLKAGGAFCPITLDVPEERLRFILEDISATLILTTSELSQQLPMLDTVEQVLVDSIDHDGFTSPSDILIQPSQAAYIMYTSGSTGTPKGVIISHSAATQALLAHDRHIPAFKRFLQFANPTFDVSVFEIFFPLFRGATLVACDRKRLLNDLPGVIRNLNVDAAELTPSVASSLLGSRSSVPGLDTLLTIGEMLQKSVVEEFGGDDADASILYGMYGPTEATIHCTLQTTCSKDMAVRNIGVPLETVSAFIVRPADDTSNTAIVEIVEIGGEGELAVGGYQLADGYLNRDEQTKAVFVCHPQHGRLYRTGDRARMTPNGTIECLGRISSGQVKLRGQGQRIELGEIEYAAAQSPHCRSAVVEVASGLLVAFCVSTSDSVSADDIRQTCQKWLPAYMVPHDILLLDALPYMPSGKVDRKALHKLHLDRQQVALPEQSLPNEKNDKIAAILTKVLQTTVSASTGLPSLGIDSLSAIRIAGELRRAGYAQIDASTVLEAQTVSELADHMAQAENAEIEGFSDWTELRASIDGHLHLAGVVDDVVDVFPCTPTQAAMLSETARDAQAYCNTVCLEVRGGVDTTQLYSALHDLSQFHPLLRSGFVATDRASTGYATIVWGLLQPTQIKMVMEAESVFSLDCEIDLQRPCRFQIHTSGDQLFVTLHVHHALYDQWSIDILKVDLSLLLQHRELGAARSFRNVAAFYAPSKSIKAAEELFWQDYLRDMTVTPIPNLTGRTLAAHLRRTSLVCESTNVAAMRAQSRDLGCSLPAVYQTAFAYLLSCYCGSSDVMFGTVVSGRQMPVEGIEAIFGPCLATLPFRVDTASARTCRELMLQVHGSNRSLQRNATTPLVEIKKSSTCAADQALFDTLFVWQETSIREDASEALVTELESIDSHEFTLVLEVEPSAAGPLLMRATFQQRLLPQAQVDTMLRQVECIAAHLLAHPDALVQSLSSALPPRLLSIANAKPASCATSCGIVGAIETQAKECPDAPALLFARSINNGIADTEAVTYAHLNGRANALAQHLRILGVLPGDLVCICMEKSIELYITLLAILKAGVGYLPLLPDTPQGRVKSVLEQAKVKLSICDASSAELLRTDRDTLTVDISEINLAHESAYNLVLPYNGSDIAYMVFTSGSTGEPKGVAVTYDNLNGNLAALAELYPTRTDDRLLQACSHAFDVSVFEIFFALTQGLCLCSATKTTLFSDLEASIRALDITHLSLTPTVAALVDPINVPSVRFLVTAGEAVTDLVHERWAGKGLHQGYGPSETTNICSVQMDVLPEHAIANVGPPLRNTSAFVVALDKPFELLPAGAVGELVFGGEQVFRGYVGREDLNAIKLLDHHTYGRLYRSGDVGRILYDGSILISGRVDDQVKIRGNRIELGEINNALLQHASVRDCTTLVHGESGAEQQLLTFWVPVCHLDEMKRQPSIYDADDASTVQLFVHLEDKLPSYMIPSTLIPVTSLPLTSQTKLDRRLLLQILSSADETRRTSFSRRTHEDVDDQDWSPEEHTVAETLAGILRISKATIGRTSSFFALGLNSLSAIAFARALGSRTGVRIGIDTVMRRSTVARLAAVLTTSGEALPKIAETDKVDVFSPSFVAGVVEQCEGRGLVVERILPCTPLQEAMLSASMASGTDAYSTTLTYRLRCDSDRLWACWIGAVARHDILRTHFVESDSSQYPFAQVTVSQDHRESYTSRTDDEPVDVGTNTGTISMLRPWAAKITNSSDGSLFTLRMHHAIYDGNSIAIMLEDVEKLYNNQVMAPPTSFEPFLAKALTHRNAESIAYWSKQLETFEPKPFPKAAGSSDTFYKTPQHVMNNNLHEIEIFCRRHGVTALSILQAAWAKVLATCQESDDICFGNVVSGRTVEVDDVEALVFPCFNTVPVRTDLRRCPNNLKLIRHLHATNISNTSFQLAPLRRLQALSRYPQRHLFDSLMLLQPPERSLDDQIWQQMDESGVMDMPSILEITKVNDQYFVAMHFSGSYMSDDLAKKLVEAFIASASVCLTYSSAKVSDLSPYPSEQIAGSLRPLQSTESHVAAEDNVAEAWSVDELHVRDVFAELSRVDPKNITKSTSMYRLGLDSLNAAQVAARLRSQGHHVTVGDIMEGLTPRAIGTTLSRKSLEDQSGNEFDGVSYLQAFDEAHRGHTASRLGVDASDVQAVRPCTPLQCGMLAQSMSTEAGLYINHITYEVPNSCDLTQLSRAWAMVQHKHQALRLGFVRSEDILTPFLSVIWSPAAVAAPDITISSNGELGVLEKRATQTIKGQLHRPVWRVTLLNEQGRYFMMLSIHHALYDAEGLQYILGDLQYAVLDQMYTAELGIDSLLVSASNWSAEQQSSDERYWKNVMLDASFAKFPDMSPKVVEHTALHAIDHVCSLGASSLEEYCKSQNCTVQAVGQAIWASLLSAYLGESLVCFGTVFSNRAASQNQATAFPCMSTIPVACSTDKSMQSIITDMVDCNSAAQRHRLTPLADIQRYAGDAQRALFDTVFVYQKTAAAIEPFRWPTFRETASVDYSASLELELCPDGKVALRLTVDSSKVPADQAQIMVSQYEHMLATLVDPTTSCPDPLISAVPAKEPRLPSKVALLHQLVEMTARELPTALALEFVNSTNDIGRWSYRQLDELGNQVAHLLRHHGVKPSSIVAVRMDKCPEASFAFLGILKAGCSFLALDPDLPQSRQAFILDDSNAAALITDQDTKDHRNGIPTIQLTERLLLHYPSESVSPTSQDSSNTCYVLYTSGTTGTPKGCEISHDSAVQAMLAFQVLFQGHWTSSSRWLQFASYWFDVSILEHFWSWSVGITLVGAPRDLVLNDIAAFMQEQRITQIDLTPSLARLVHPDEVPSLHGGVFITGGEALKQEIIDAWGHRLTVCNGYGPTEATIGVTMNTFIGPDAKPSNIGKQFDNVGTYVLDANSDRVVLRGAVGELAISGSLVGKGYLNRPDLTAKAFPTLSHSGERIYRTGDLVRLLADGSFSFIGRKDMQAKIRGQRFETGEVDSIVKASSDMIENSVSMVVADEGGVKQTLVTFVTLKSSDRTVEVHILHTDEAGTALKDAMKCCKQHLPGYMTPTHILPLSKLPLTVNNKEDTKGLAALYRSLEILELQALTRGQKHTEPLTDAERRVGDILCDMLGIEVEVLHHDSNIFSLGMSSVSAISFASLLKRKGYRLASIAMLMRNSTLGQLTNALTHNDKNGQELTGLVQQARLMIAAFSRQHRATVARQLSVETSAIETITPCTPLQAGLLLDSLRDPQKPYFNKFLYRLHDVNLHRLRRAVQLMAPVLQLLRTKFVQTEGGFASVVMRQAETIWSDCTDTNQTTYEALDNQRDEWLTTNDENLIQPLRIAVSGESNNRMLAIFVHHALYDGIAWDLFMDKLAETYLHDTSPDSGPDFTTLLAYGPLSQQPDASAFWKERLFGLQPTPLHRVGPKDGERMTATAGVVIRKGTQTEVMRKQLSVSHQALVQTCFEAALQHSLDQVSVYGQVYSGRAIEFEGADRCIGPMFNTLPLAINFVPKESWRDHVVRCHDSNVKLLPYQHTSLRDIRKWCGLDPTIPAFDVLFVFQHQTKQPVAEKHDLWHDEEQDSQPSYPLAFEVTMGPDGTLDVAAVALRSVADEAMLSELLVKFGEALNKILEQPDNIISEDFKVSHKARETEPDNTRPLPDMNGVHDFVWSEGALILRRAVAGLSSIDVESVDEHSTIFTLGLDSIDAVRLSSIAKKAGVPLSVSQILRAQTIPKMMDATRESTSTPNKRSHESRLRIAENELTKIVSAELRDMAAIVRVLPATPNQEALLADMLRSGYRDYYNHDILRLREDVDLERYKAAWQSVIDSAPILRTGFLQLANIHTDATFAQIVWQPRPLRYTEFTSTSTALTSVTQEVSADDKTATPMRLSLINEGSVRYLVLSLAHAQYDGHSLALLHEDVRAAYYQNLRPRPCYDLLIQTALEATVDEARSFWASHLSGVELRTFPHREENALVDTYRSERASRLAASTVRSFCKQHGISMQALAQTCWSVLLSHYVRSFEVVFGVVLACRDSEEAEQMMFPAMNTVPMRTSLHGSRLDMLKYLQSTTDDMRAYQRTPLRTIQAACVQAGSLPAGRRLFDTLFIYQHRPEATSNGEEPLYDSIGGNSSVEYPVAVEMEVLGDEVLMRAACKSSVLDEQGTVDLLQYLDEVLSAIVEHPAEPTVSFNESEASICGLPAFVLESQEDATDASQPISDADTMQETQELSETACSIRETLAQVARLPIDDVPPTAAIESLGIDSISAIKVATLLRRQGISLTVSEILQAKTTIKMAKAADTKSPFSTAESVPSAQVIAKALDARSLTTLPGSSSIDQSTVESTLPATAGQIYMVKIWQASDGQLFYPTFGYELKGGFDVEQLRRAWQDLSARHGILRTVVHETGDDIMPLLQVVLKEVKNSFTAEDEEHRPDHGQPMVALHGFQEHNAWRLELNIHHALYDAVSLPILIQDFKALLARVSPQQASVVYPDFLALSVSADSRETRKKFWTSYLRDITPLQLRQPEASGQQKRIELFKPGLFPDVSKLERLSRKQGVTVQALVFAAYAKLYASLATASTYAKDEGSDVVLGIYLSNRSHVPDLDKLAAPTLNLVPLLIRSASEKSLLELAKQVQIDLGIIGSAQNSAVGLWEIAEWTGVRVDTFVNFIKLPEQSEDIEDEGGVAITELDERRTTEYARVAEPKDVGAKAPLSGLEKTALGDAYLFSVDLEATVTHGALDVGLFAPEEMLGLEKGEKVLAELRDMLGGLV
ncbi:NRPS protein [Elasticomyces elasticus]|uniref:NRPS protein n=1 Tax=Elasticomyces elasticus TaxID=574655 RepID=A0AAN7W3S8_9PEZI|nr:NRPS protein [Elasticomyces elasticus]